MKTKNEGNTFTMRLIILYKIFKEEFVENNNKRSCHMFSLEELPYEIEDIEKQIKKLEEHNIIEFVGEDNYRTTKRFDLLLGIELTL